MDLTDACVFPYPLGDSSLRRLAGEAGRLGFTSIVAIGEGPCKAGTVQVIRGELIQEGSVRELLWAIKKVPKEAGQVLVNAGDNAFNRTAITQRKTSILRHIYKTDPGAFDHVTARLAADRDVAIDLDIRPLIFQRGVMRQNVIRRYAEIVKLHRRFGFPLTLSSHALSVLEQRSVREITGLCSLFDMTETEVYRALGTVGRIAGENSPVRVVA